MGQKKKIFGHMGAREAGKHLITTGGFLDDTYWHRIFWMYGETWPGFNHANVASKSGQLLVIGPEKTYSFKMKSESLRFRDRFDILLGKRLSGVAELNMQCYMGNPRLNQRR